jgi:hypothetical protein
MASLGELIAEADAQGRPQMQQFEEAERYSDLLQRMRRENMLRLANSEQEPNAV